MSDFSAPLEKHKSHHVSKSGRKADKKAETSILMFILFKKLFDTNTCNLTT